MDRDAKLMRQEGPTIFTQARHNVNIDKVAELILAAMKEQTTAVTSASWWRHDGRSEKKEIAILKMAASLK